MKSKVDKRPEFENDSYLINMSNFFLYEKIYDDYTELKLKKFKEKDISKDGFDLFIKGKGSFRKFEEISNLEGSIYTKSVEERNNDSYENVIADVKNILKTNESSRKAVVRIANKISDYETSELETKDVSCLNLIHYLKNKVSFVFRSSDIKNELFTDLVTLYEYFIVPVYGRVFIDIEVYGSTGQNISYLDEVLKQLENENESN